MMPQSRLGKIYGTRRIIGFAYDRGMYKYYYTVCTICGDEKVMALGSLYNRQKCQKCKRQTSPTPPAVKLWIDTVFKDAVVTLRFGDKEWEKYIEEMSKAGQLKGHNPFRVMSNIIAGFVLKTAGMDPEGW